ncbi:MAG: 50S ribosomal protein L11 methyltransferase [Thermovibrio sp.]|nr:MAG: 50S ribosomal protein L11 methyltransferase [Thermovibrio sp.]
MEFREVLFKVPASEFDRVSVEVFEAGALGVEILSEGNEVLFKAFFRGNSRLPDGLKAFLVSESILKERDWNEEWKKHFRPLRITERIWVAPSWEKGKFVEPEGSLVLYIYPGRGFGTGTHETTQLVIELIEETLNPGDSFLDVGTGSGILSILSKRLGAQKVVACDIQEGIEEEFFKNCSLNGVSEITFIEGSVDRVSGTFDLVVANIEKHLLLPLLEGIYERTGKRAIFSGILTSQREEFLEELKKVGFKPLSERCKGEWMAFLCEK